MRDKKNLVGALIILIVTVGSVTAGAWYFLGKKNDPSTTASDKSKSMSQPVQPATNRKNPTPATDNKTSKTPPTNPTSPTTPQASTTPQGAQASQATAANTVNITTTAFAPGNIAVKKGTLITWINKDTANHAIAESDDLAGPHSPQLKPGESYTYTFAKAGTYHYKCVLVPSLAGTITVTD